MGSFEDRTYTFQVQMVQEALDQCTEGQKATFKIVFPYGLDGLSTPKLRDAYYLLQRTIRSNEDNMT